MWTRYHCQRRQISIHAPREGSDTSTDCRLHIVGSISIHAPREGSDAVFDGAYTETLCISIHAPREGSDRTRWSKRPSLSYFNPRSPRGERPKEE